MRIPITYLVLAIVVVVSLCLAGGQFKQVAQEAQRLSEIQQEKDLAAFKEGVKKIQDPRLATERGMKFLNQKDTRRACALFERAASLDQNYRDASFYLGYAYLKDIDLRKGKLTAAQQHEELQKAKAALIQAQKIDPLYPLTNKLLAIISQNENNDNEKQLWYARYDTVSGNQREIEQTSVK